jgi:hypothetical protein
VRGARQQAHLTEAESRLKQVSVALDLYFKKYGRYPAAGKNLGYELAEFVGNHKIFENPLNDESWPGESISYLYQEPSTEDLDGPGTYLVAFTSDDGKTAVILETNGKIITTNQLEFPTDNSEESLNDAKIDIMTYVEEEENAGEEVVGIHPNLAIFTKYFVRLQSMNQGHGNNIDHDDYDNSGVGIGGHGTVDGFIPDDSMGYDTDQLRGRQYTITDSGLVIGIANTTTPPHSAAGVCVEITVHEGAEHLKSMKYDGTIGDIPAGKSAPLTVELDVNPTFYKAGLDVFIRFRITITAEENDPDANVGKYVDVLLVRQ